MRFEFATDNKIIFGEGTVTEAGPAARSFGKRALITAGLSTEGAQPLLDSLSQNGVEAFTFGVYEEPTIDLARRGVQYGREVNCDLVIGIGGGSSVDTGKAAAALLTNPGDPLDYLEVIGKGQPLKNPPLPYIAIPTTSGTGSEVTRNAVLGSPEQEFKVSLRSPLMLPRLAIIDPVLTYSLPPLPTATTGLDALTQLIEPYTSNKANPMTDPFCREGMALVARSLHQAYLDGKDASARRDMSLASLFGGLALANAGLGAAHGFAAPFGGMFPAPHGAICARLLPFVMETNILALRRRDPDNPVLRRYDEVARIMTGSPDAGAMDGVSWVRDLCAALNIPSLSSYGMTSLDIPELVEKGKSASSMKANPLVLTDEELRKILELAL